MLTSVTTNWFRVSPGLDLDRATREFRESLGPDRGSLTLQEDEGRYRLVGIDIVDQALGYTDPGTDDDERLDDLIASHLLDYEVLRLTWSTWDDFGDIRVAIHITTWDGRYWGFDSDTGFDSASKELQVDKDLLYT